MTRALRLGLSLVLGCALAAQIVGTPPDRVAADTSTTLLAMADAYVDELQPDANFGDNIALRTDGAPIMRSYLLFDVTGAAAAQSVTLQVFAETANSVGIDLHPADTGWTESDITFGNAPAPGAVIGSSGPIAARSWLSFDVTAMVTADGPLAFAIDSPSGTATRFSSRSGTNPPRLVMVSQPPTDPEPPTPPRFLRALRVTSWAALLAWRPATDNVGVVGYLVKRDGVVVGSVDRKWLLFFIDHNLAPGTTYTYTVVALDAAGNQSADSNAVTITTRNGRSTTLPASADSYVDASQPDANFGSNIALRTDGSPVLRSYLQFDVLGVARAQSVTLRIFAETANATGIDLHVVADNAWTEATITFGNAPATGPVVASSGPITAGTWISFDVTNLVSADGLVSFAIDSTSPTATRFSSRSGSNPPQLVITRRSW